MLNNTNEAFALGEVIKADDGLLDYSETILGLKWAAVTILDKTRESTICESDKGHYLNNVEAIVMAMAYISTAHKAISDYKSLSADQ